MAWKSLTLDSCDMASQPKASTLRTGRRYRASRVDASYDAIVIGSGPGGLSTAACLSRMGKKVAVLEQHYTAGGFTHAYNRNGYEWDVGVHFVNDVVNQDHFFRKLFDFITNAKLQWTALHEDKLLLSFGDQPQVVVKMHADKDKAALKEAFPEEASAIDAIFAHAAKTLARAMPFLLMQKLSGSGWMGRGVERLATSCIPKDVFRSAFDVMRDFTDNEKLICILCSLWAAVGITPERQSYLFVAGGQINTSPMGYPVGGSGEIAKRVIPVVQQSRGDVFTYAKVDEILFEAERAVGVKMADGHRINAPIVVSGAGVFNTFRHLVPEPISQRSGYSRKLRSVEQTVGHIGLFIGFDGTNEELGLRDSEHLMFNSMDFEADAAAFADDLEAPIPMLFVTFPSAKDPTWQQRFPGKSTSSIFIYVENFEHFAQWQNEQWGKRGAAYEALKERLAHRVLETVYEHYPQLRGRVDYYEVSTPVSTQYFSMYEKGEIYGLHHDVNRLRHGWLKPKTRIRGLYLCGQDTLSLGHTTGVLSGLLTASRILGWRQSYKLWKQVLA